MTIGEFREKFLPIVGGKIVPMLQEVEERLDNAAAQYIEKMMEEKQVK